MKQIQIRFVIKLLVFLILVSFLFPSIKLFGFGMKIDLLFIYPLFLLVRIVSNEINSNDINKVNGIFAALIFFSMLLSNTLGKYSFENSFGLVFPTEYLQILNRVVVFYCFFFIAYYQIVRIKRFTIILNIIFILSLFVGVLQSIGFSPIIEFSKIYALSENQTKGFESLNSRIYGTSGNILTWAGLCGFLFFYFLFFKQPNKYFKISGIILSLFNLIFSLSRGAIIALIITLVISNIIKGFYEKKLSRSLIRVVQIGFVLIVFAYIFYLYFPDRVELVFLRFQNLNSEVNETGRSKQIEIIQSFMNVDYWNYLFGIGKDQLDQIGLMEIEFFFNLFAYGLLGTFIIYFWIFYLVKQGFLLRNVNPNFSLFIISSFLFYLIFSFGYFFIKEIYSGLIFWLIIGYSFGYIERKEKYYDITSSIH